MSEKERTQTELTIDTAKGIARSMLRAFLYPIYDDQGRRSDKIMDMEPGDCQRILSDFAAYLGMEEGS